MKRINTPSVLFIIAVALLVTAVVEAQLIEENFDSYATNSQLPSPWFYWGSSGTILINDTTYLGTSGKSLECDRMYFDYQPFTVGHGLTPPLEGQGEMTYYFRLTGGSDREVFSVFGHNYQNNAVAWWVTHGGWFGNAVGTYSEDQEWTHIMDVSNDTWYGVHLVIDVDTHTYDITVWEDTNPANTNTVPDLDFRNGLLADPIDDIQIGDFSQTSIDQRIGYLDDLRLVGPRIFLDDFESGDPGAWSGVNP